MNMKLILLSVFLLSLSSYKIIDKKDAENGLEIFNNTKLNIPGEVRRSNIDFNLLSSENRRIFPRLERDTLYGKINFSKNSKCTQSDFINIIGNYKNNLKKLKDDGFYNKGVSGVFLPTSEKGDTLFFENNYVKITNDHIKCLLRVRIVFDAIGALKPDEKLSVLDIRILTEEQNPEFTTTEQKNIMKEFKNFGELPPPPPGN